MSSKPESIDRLTLDTNVPRAVWDERPGQEAVQQLLDLSAAGDVELWVTAYIQDDIPREPLRSRINDLGLLGVAVEEARVTVLGEWVLGRDFLGSGEFEDFRLAKIAGHKPGDPGLPGHADWMHLHAHFARGRDVFLTWDGDILLLAEELERALGLRVKTPEAYLLSR